MPKRSLPPRPWTPRGVEVRHTPGLADQTMRELAPYLAEDGIDLESSAPARWPGSSAVDDIISRASLGGAFDSLDYLSVNHGGRALHYGSASALAVVFRAWSIRADIPASDLVAKHIR